ncbi:MAG: hypothetical protein WBW84_10875 [Acidobacteriaceae bacterium]
MIIQHAAKAASILPPAASALDSAISALKSCISALESSLKTVGQSSGQWETLAWVCSVGVAFGVAAEIIGIIWQYRDDLRDWRRGIIRPPDRPSRGKLWFEAAATVLVVAGIFGEAGASLKLASINSQLRSITSELRAKSDQLLALVTQEAGSAATSAQKAHREADVVSSEALELSQQLTKQDLREHLLQNKRNRDRFVAILKPFTGQKFDIRPCTLDDSEVTSLSLVLYGAMLDAGWTNVSFRPYFACGNGVVVLVDNDAPDSTKRAASALQRALFAVGLTNLRRLGPGDFVDVRALKPGQTTLEPSAPNGVVLLVQTHP